MGKQGRLGRFEGGFVALVACAAAAGCGEGKTILDPGNNVGPGGMSAGGSGGTSGGGTGGTGEPPAPEECVVSFVSPTDDGQPVTLGGSEEACGESSSTQVVVTSSAAAVELIVNGTPIGSRAVNNLTASFGNVELSNRGTTANTLVARATMDDGRTCEVSFGADLFVDCDGPSCALQNPIATGGYLDTSDDTAEGSQGFQTSFEVTTDASDVSLVINGEPLSQAPVLASGVATFDLVTLPSGPGQRVQAVCTDDAGNTTSSSVGSYTVGTEGCEVAFVSPAVTGTDPVTLGGSEAACAGTFSADVVVSTTAANVSLSVNGSDVGSQPVAGLTSTFSDVPLTNRGATANTLVATADMGDGRTCQATFPVDLLVDCEGPSCTLGDPAPAAPVHPVTGEKFLNAAADSSGATAGFQIPFAVTTDASSVHLLIDGEQSDATATVDSGVATFADVTLAEGTARRVQAVCSDETGNVTRSTIREWTVDTQPCVMDPFAITTAESLATPLDDLDAADGIQLSAAGDVTGSDCSGVRIQDCVGSPESFSSAALELDKSWALTLTVPSSTGDVNVCAQVEDFAGNVGELQQTLGVRIEDPELAIISPATAAAFNSANDGDGGTTTCELDIVVDCSDVGEDVALFFDGAAVDDPDSPGTDWVETCVASGSSTLAGQATFALAPVPTRNNGGTVALEARQTVVGLEGSSTTTGAVAIQSDCEAPSPFFSANSLCGEQLAIGGDDTQPGTLGMQHTVRVTGGDPGNPVSIVASPPSGDLAAVFGVLSGASDLFEDLTIATDTDTAAVTSGGPATVTLTASQPDTAGNVGTVQCEFTLVDQAVVNISAPADNTIFSSASADCSGDPGLQVQVDATTDAAENAPVTVSIGAGTPSSGLTVGAGGAISACVDAPEGVDQTLTVAVGEFSGNAAGSDSITVTVDTLAPPGAIAMSLNSVTDRRAGSVQFDWTAVADDGGGALDHYELRCSSSDITNETEWDAAQEFNVTSVPQASGAGESEVILSDDPAGQDGGFRRMGVTKFCVMRGADVAGQLSPIGTSTQVLSNFLTQTYTTITDTGSGLFVEVSPLGDINGDGVDDMAYGGTTAPPGATAGNVEILFGDDTNATPDTAVDITLTGAHGSFGGQVAALGDVNNDDLPDFAVSARADNGVLGSVYVFYGRDVPGGDPAWPSTITVSNSPGCGADLCLRGETSLGFFGVEVTGGDFDGDGENDIIVGASGDGSQGLVYVVRGGSQLAGLSTGTEVSIPSDDPQGFVITPPASSAFDFGTAATALGPLSVLSSGGADLAIGSAADTGSGILRTLWLMESTPYPLAPVTNLVAVTPTAFDTTFLAIPPVRAIGDFDGDGLTDLAAGNEFTDRFDVYLRQSGSGVFDETLALSFVDNAPLNDNYGRFIAEGFVQGLGQLGDLDGDGIAELLAGAESGADANLFYGGAGVAVNRTLSDFSYTTFSTQAVPNFVGDINGDGHNDFVVLDSGFGANALVLHY